MSDSIRTQIKLPRDLFECLKQNEEARGLTLPQQILEALRAYLESQDATVFQADDPILRLPAAMGSGAGDLSTEHDHYLYSKDWQEQGQAA